MIKITNLARGGRGLRIMWQCEEMGLPYEAEIVPYPFPGEYRARNPAGGVPFLEDGAVAINESIAIMLYLAEKYGPTPLLPAKNDPAFARVLQLTVLSEATFGAAMNTLIATHFVAPEAEKRNWSVRGIEERLEGTIAFVADTLGDKPFLVGESLTLADIAIGTAFGIWQGALRKTLPDKINAYRERLTARPAYQRALLACNGPGN